MPEAVEVSGLEQESGVYFKLCFVLNAMGTKFIYIPYPELKAIRLLNKPLKYG